jgi:flagellar basal-body rod protein FlgF
MPKRKRNLKTPERKMLKELYTAAMGMLPQQTRLEVIANNMANANTAGFKRESVFERNLIDARANFYNVPGDAEQDDPPVGSYVDYAAGAFQKTDNPLDVAIDSIKQFFVLQDEAGKEYLTRSGQFKISTDGTITAMDGKILLGDGGPLNVAREFAVDPLSLNDKMKTDLRITDQGEVFLNEHSIGHIQLAEVENLSSLEKISNQNFIITDDSPVHLLTPEEVSVKQGWLENSNVDIVKEMVQMIELQRMFELGSKVIQTNDGTLENSIRIGRYF